MLADAPPPKPSVFAVWRWKWWKVVLMIGASYLLSIGPIFWLSNRHRIAGWAGIPYRPLGALISTGWDFGVLKWYLQWWE